MKRRYVLALLASTATVVGASPAWAQDASAAGKQDASTAQKTAKPGDVDTSEIIVTANKRAERLHDVPMAISAVTQDYLEKTHSTNLAEFLTQVPGVNYNTSGQGAGTLNIRGINAGGVASTVGTYIDEAPYGSSSALANASVLAADLNPFDMQRVEVLKGPQGTLYGAGALGGVVKYVTNAPDPRRFAGQVTAGLRKADHGGTGYDFNGMVNIPVAEHAAIRVTGYSEQRPGFIDDPVNDRRNINVNKVYGGRISGLWDATDRLSLRATALVQNVRAQSTSEIDIETPTSATDIRPLFGDLQYTDAVPGDRQPRLRVAYRLYNGLINWDLDWAKLTSSTSYSTLKFVQYQDFTAFFGLSEILTNLVEQNKFTQEFRLASKRRGPLQWQLGYYHTREKANIHQVLNAFVDGHDDLDQLLPSTYTEDAIFGQATYALTSTVDVTGGLRWANDRQFGGQKGQAFGTPFSLGQQSKESALTYSVAPRWRPNNDTTVYARVASGYVAGGPNVIDVIHSPAGTPTSFGSEKLTNYEIGWKQILLDGALSFDLAAFHISWDKIQLLGVVNGVAITTNGGTASSNGVEWGIRYAPLPRLTLGWNGSYADAHLTSDAPSIVGAKKGDPLPLAPRLNTTVTGDYTWPAFRAFDGYVGATLQYRDSEGAGFITGLPYRQYILPDYFTANLRAGLKSDSLSLDLYVNNVTDQRGYVSLSQNFSFIGSKGSPSGGYQAGVIQPRTFGLSVSKSF